MHVIYGLNQIRKFRAPAVAIGVFDGVHRGHRLIITRAVKKARVTGGTGMAVTFWPHPAGEKTLYSLEHRLRLIQELGVAACVVIRFSKAFSALTPECFVRRILCRRIGARFVFVGENFRFGRGARGSVRTLRALAQGCGYRLSVCPVMKAAGVPVSSTLIRKQIIDGRLNRARQLLGRPVSILGTVIHGASLGKKWGVPTANVDPRHEIRPPEGIYAVRVYLGARAYQGVCYIGGAPRFLRTRRASPEETKVEVHILRFSGDIYDRNIEIQFLKKIRERMEFSNPADLLSQIKKDISKAVRIR